LLEAQTPVFLLRQRVRRVWSLVCHLLMMVRRVWSLVCHLLRMVRRVGSFHQPRERMVLRNPDSCNPICQPQS